MRIHLYNGIAGSSSPVYIYNPDGSSIYDDTTGHSYFNVLNVLNGGDYNRKLLYYALFKPDRSMANYKCKFLDMIPSNYNYIKALKANQPILYKKLIIPTPITYESYIYAESAGDGTQLQIKCPVGGKITVVNATWGKGDIRINEPSYETRTHTDPPKIIDGNTTTYEWTTPNPDIVAISDGVLPSGHKVTNGFLFEEFEGNSNGDPNWYTAPDRNPSNRPTGYGRNPYPSERNLSYSSDKSIRATGYINGLHEGQVNNSQGFFTACFKLTTSRGCKAKAIINNMVYETNGDDKRIDGGGSWRRLVGFAGNLQNVYTLELYSSIISILSFNSDPLIIANDFIIISSSFTVTFILLGL